MNPGTLRTLPMIRETQEQTNLLINNLNWNLGFFKPEVYKKGEQSWGNILELTVYAVSQIRN